MNAQLDDLQSKLDAITAIEAAQVVAVSNPAVKAA